MANFTHLQSTALLTDRYEFTMLDAALLDGRANTPSTFELFARALPAGRRYGVVAGVGRFLSALADYQFDEATLQWLSDEHVVSKTTLHWLEDFHFDGTIRGYREGELYFPHSPLVTIETDFAHGVVLETLALSIYNYDSAIASAASRMVTAARGRPLAEMGSRRANEYAAVAGTRAAYIAGFSASSNLAAGQIWGIPTMGTAAHAFTLLYPTEVEAFTAQINAMGKGTTLLVDTYDIAQGVQHALDVAGIDLGGIRIDSGDLPVVVAQVRQQLDQLGATNTTITVTNDLDEYAIAALASSPVDSYGVGTAVLTGSGHPTCGMVYKLTARQDANGTWIPVEKLSAGKAHHGGRKTATRVLNANGIAVEERIDIEPYATLASSGRRLDTVFVDHGTVDPQYLGPEGTNAARDFHLRTREELPAQALRMTRGEAAIPTTFA